MNLDWRVVEDNMARHGLTERQREYVRLWLAGLSAERIARGMFIRHTSVRTALWDIRRRVGAAHPGRLGLLRALLTPARDERRAA